MKSGGCTDIAIFDTQDSNRKVTKSGSRPQPISKHNLPLQYCIRYCPVLVRVLYSVSDYGTSSATRTVRYCTSPGSVGTRVLGLRLSVTDRQIHAHTEKDS